MDALDFLDRLLTINRAPATDLKPVERLLEHLGYESMQRRNALAWIAAHGTAIGCVWLEVWHEQAAEAVRLGVDSECHDNCIKCQDEATFRASLLESR